ncbi:MAG TPA: dUTP diphosphatase [Thermomicrobiales bacterium]|nr:dUTP diphosphatase [Thermomicrobiales bacterium]
MPDDAPLRVRIARVDPDLPLPAYETPGAVGFDLLARVATTVPPGGIARIPANVIVETPPGYMLLVAARSSTPAKKGLSVPHGIGIVDQDYCGPDDEIRLQVYNFTAEPVTIARGERLAQGVFVRVDRAVWEEIPASDRPTRGGFGSTGGAPRDAGPEPDPARSLS